MEIIIYSTRGGTYFYQTNDGIPHAVNREVVQNLIRQGAITSCIHSHSIVSALLVYHPKNNQEILKLLEAA